MGTKSEWLDVLSVALRRWPEELFRREDFGFAATVSASLREHWT
jgi:hypothetical protein